MKPMKNKMSDTEKQAKLGVVHRMRDMASDMMKSKLGGLKKISVASNDPRGLEMGLEKAHDLVSGGEFSKSPEHEATESTEEEMEEECLSTPEEVDAKIAELQALKEKMLSEG